MLRHSASLPVTRSRSIPRWCATRGARSISSMEPVRRRGSARCGTGAWWPGTAAGCSSARAPWPGSASSPTSRLRSRSCGRPWIVPSAIKALEQLLLPAECLVCHGLLAAALADDLVCPVCRLRWRPVRPPWCERCGQPEPHFGPCRLCREWPEALRSVRSGVWLDGGARLGGARVEVRRPAAHRPGHGDRVEPDRRPAAIGSACRPHSTGVSALEAPRLQSERGAGTRPGTLLGACGVAATACQDARYADTDGVDTGGAPSERGGGVSIADWKRSGGSTRNCSRGRRVYHWRDDCRGGAGAGWCGVHIDHGRDLRPGEHSGFHLGSVHGGAGRHQRVRSDRPQRDSGGVALQTDGARVRGASTTSPTPRRSAHLLKYDSVHGRFPGTVEVRGEALVVNGKEIRVTAIKEPEKLPWKDLGVELVLESTGRFTDRDSRRQAPERRGEESRDFGAGQGRRHHDRHGREREEVRSRRRITSSPTRPARRTAWSRS